MKKLLLILILLTSFSAYGIAQNYVEVVYLKNGSVIRGSIIEQVPNESLKIKMSDGSIFICSMTDVEKIAKEIQEKPLAFKKKQRSTLKGYKGFFDVGYLWDTEENNAVSANKIELSTSHGYQFSNHFFIGGGFAVNRYNDAGYTAIPIFTDFRVNFLKKKVTPFSNIRVGYTAGDLKGVYLSLAAGVRFTLKAKMALYLKMEFASQGYDEYVIAHWFGIDEGYHTLNSFGLKAGFEF